MRRFAGRALLALALLSALTAGLAAEEAAAKPANAVMDQAVPTWILGISRFTAVENAGEGSILLSALPRLIASELRSLPVRRRPADEAEEARALKIIRSRFAAGADLAAKLDALSLGFLDPSRFGEERRVNILSAEKAVEDSSKKLDEAMAESEKLEEAPSDTLAKLWEGHEKGQLIDPPGQDPAKAAKAAGVDLLVAGSISLESSYAIVVIKGFDALLDREVFSWKSFSSMDDPEPLAHEIAVRLERWSAGRDYARLELRPDPPAAEIYVNGVLTPGSSRVAYVYEEGTAKIIASAEGHASAATEINLSFGDRRAVELKLEPVSTGSLSLTTVPAGAYIIRDSIPLGQSPLAIGLDGSRAIVSASAEGWETETVVLPSSGAESMDLKLLPADELGPAGRISAAKDRFYSAFGWTAVCVPATLLTLGVFNGYNEAYLRTGSTELYNNRNNAGIALAALGAATAASAIFSIVRLVKYLKTAH